MTLKEWQTFRLEEQLKKMKKIQLQIHDLDQELYSIIRDLSYVINAIESENDITT